MDAKMSLVHPSLAEIHEKELVRYLLSHPWYRMDLLGIHGIPDNVRAFLEIELKDAPGNFKGDIDILLCAPGRPDSAIAIQVKRVKVGASTFRSGKPNKLEKYKEGVWQANDLARMGFSQVFLYVLVSVDSRERNAGQISYAGITPEMRDMIGRTISTNDLDSRVGLVLFDFVQPMDYAPLDGPGTGGTCLIRSAKEVVQPADLTAWVERVIQGTAF